MVEEKIQKGKSKKQALKEVEAETGLKENSVKVAHQRAEKKKQLEPESGPELTDLPGGSAMKTFGFLGKRPNF